MTMCKNVYSFLFLNWWKWKYFITKNILLVSDILFVIILYRKNGNKNPGTINWDVTWWLLCKKSGVLYYSTIMVLQICALPSWMNWSLAGQINWPQASVMARASPNLIAPPLTRLRLYWPAIDKIAMRNQFWEARNCFPRDSPDFILSFWRIPN